MGFMFFPDNIHAEFNTLIADKNGGARNQLSHLVLRLPAEGAIQCVFRVTRLAAHNHSDRPKNFR
jgi:hypothetical protein